MPSRPTITDVARVAGVSKTTVSYFLSGSGYVSTDKRERIRTAITSLGYQPNAFARGLSSRRLSAIGILSSNPADELVARITSGILAEASERDIVITISAHSTNPRPEELRRAAWGHASDGMIYIASHADSEEAFAELRRLCPVVLAGEAGAGEHVPAVRLDPRPAARDLAQLVASCGHQRVAVVIPDAAIFALTSRVDGLIEGLAAVGYGPDAVTIVPAQISPDGGKHAADHLYGDRARRSSAPTAVLCVDDSVALGVAAQCRSLGLHVPNQISVTGFGESRAASAARPALTTAHIPAEEIGRAALQMLISDDGRGQAAQTVLHVPATLVGGVTVQRAMRSDVIETAP
jgi:LacI family transcriptional regulator